MDIDACILYVALHTVIKRLDHHEQQQQQQQEIESRMGTITTANFLLGGRNASSYAIRLRAEMFVGNEKVQETEIHANDEWKNLGDKISIGAVTNGNLNNEELALAVTVYSRYSAALEWLIMLKPTATILLPTSGSLETCYVISNYSSEINYRITPPSTPPPTISSTPPSTTEPDKVVIKLRKELEAKDHTILRLKLAVALVAGVVIVIIVGFVCYKLIIRKVVKFCQKRKSISPHTLCTSKNSRKD